MVNNISLTICNFQGILLCEKWENNAENKDQCGKIPKKNSVKYASK